MEMNVYDYSEELEFISKIAKDSSLIYMNADRSEYSLKNNAVGVFDIVTNSDVSTENHIINEIKKQYPNDLFICEEKTNDDLTNERTWIIDPIDGTVNYCRGIPLFGTQLALLVNKIPVLALIYLPSNDELYTATEKNGARLNGVLLKITDERPINECIISLSDFSRKCQYFRDMQAKLILNMYDCVARLKIFGASCCDFGMLASGKIDIHIRFVNNVWDYIPGLYISKKAGAYVDEELLKNEKFLLIGSSKKICNDFRLNVIKNLFEVQHE